MQDECIVQRTLGKVFSAYSKLGLEIFCAQ